MNAEGEGGAANRLPHPAYWEDPNASHDSLYSRLVCAGSRRSKKLWTESGWSPVVDAPSEEHV